MMDAGQVALVAGGGLAAGAVNAVAGGGSLISFPALLASGLSALPANVTNTVALCPGYLGSLGPFRRELRSRPQRRRLRKLTPVTVVGAGVGVALLQASSASTFRALVPWLVLFACALFAVQPRLAGALAGRREERRRAELGAGALAAQGATAAYGAYFGAAAGVIMLGTLGVAIDDTLPRVNAVKAWLQLTMNLVAAVAFVFIAPVHWFDVAVMAPCALIGGHGGAALSLRVSERALRAVVLVCGVGAAIALLLT
jgi:uncharacterized membrane protein YfcA